MYAALSTFKGIAKLSSKAPDTENLVFKLNGRLTVLLLIIFSALVTMDTFFGKTIECFTTHKGEFPEKYLDTYCWMHATYTMADAYDKKVGKVVIAPGVDNSEPNGERIYHSYYQWVGIFLFVAGITFHLPHFIWKNLEGQRLEKTMLGLNILLAEDDKQREKSVQSLANHLKRSQGNNTCYALTHAACEMLNLLVVLGQIFLTDAFLGGEFLEYGSEVISYDRADFTDRTDPMVKLFPRVAKCTAYKAGPSGSLQNHDAVCVLATNVANEKIFIFLWFWYVILAVVSGLAIVYRSLLMYCRGLRLRVLLCGCRRADRFLLESLVLDHVVNYSDWFVLRLLEKNLTGKNFCDLVNELYRLMEKEVTLTADNIALVNLKSSAYEYADTLPVEVKTNLYATAKVRMNSGSKLNGTRN